MSRPPRLDARLLAAVAAMLLMWASAFAAIRMALGTFPPGELALLRFLVASGTLAALAAGRRVPAPRRGDLPAIAVLGFLAITVYHLGLNYGERTVTAGAASLLIASAPAFTALLARLVLREELGRSGWLGIALGFAGVALISLGEGEAFRLDPGALLILLSALSASAYSVLQKKFIVRYPPLAFTTYVVAAGTIPLLVFLPGLLATLRTAPAGGSSPSSTSGPSPGGSRTSCGCTACPGSRRRACRASST